MTDVATRLARLEKSLAQAQQQQPTPEITEPNRKPSRSNFNGRSREDILVQKGSSSQYFNEVFLSRVIEEEHNVESALMTPPMESPHPARSLSINALGILSSPSPSALPSHYHPPKQTAVKLWTIYINNVEGCSGLKLLHIPTDEIKMYSIVDDPATASLDDLALNFAIYFAAISTLDDDEAQVTLGQDKQSLLLRFKIGVEQSFAHGDFLNSPTVTGLQALAIYLSALRVHNCGKGIWILDGLAIRVAHALGLHRDGKGLGLSPFQSEIRRRLWWHLLSRDIRAGEDYGLENTSSLLLTSDVGLPANIDDTDISPVMQQPPEPKVGWTAMTFSLINIDLAKTVQKLSTLAASSSPSSPPREEIRAQIMKECKIRMENWLSYCNLVIPQHRLALFCSRFAFRKLDFTTRLQWDLLRNTDPRANFATEANLVEALDLIFPRINDDDLLKQYAWAGKVYPQYHVTMYVLWHLCVQPEGPNADRAWQAIERSFSDGMRDDSATRLGSKSSVLAALRAKAMLIRQRIRERNAGVSTGEHPSAVAEDQFLDDGRFRDGGFDGDGFPAQLLGDAGVDELGVDRSEDGWLNWGALVQSFQLNSPETF
ncbi:uncharacterized protein Z519_06938 [Cladophialophora bantiana CBS 173.52]|uniref:Xylanolytic transcriptional activator regulatory domain-containing protein n=1 Tax=Cladophialophora bantiana (strain ATCC 10958 / CBS 173.52 / CDC B-1940 / NIH 8579) TaxID=1442370 RepID=A0A0D2EPR7_CLAB1|nr:uncharacterized protein Z519_06938 [Cladophialophora bantiana CBS 173.52]KIW91956.1 hypothetical protein Z519_06938 [Cladophialophora bantiana CBS 173.52]